MVYLDMIWHLPDRTTITKDEFDKRLIEILETDSWIIDGNYGRTIKKQGYEQTELTVVGGNDGAYHLYESIGFKECGRIPNANKYDDGTYSDDILMVMLL